MTWIPVTGVVTVILRRGIAVPPMTWREATSRALISVPMCLIYAFVCLSTWYACRAVPLQETSSVRVFVTLATASALPSLLWFGMGLSWALLIEPVTDLKLDLLLLYIQMPRLDGFEVLDLINRETNVIFVTAYDQQHRRNICRERGV